MQQIDIIRQRSEELKEPSTPRIKPTDDLISDIDDILKNIKRNSEQCRQSKNISQTT